MKLPAFKVHNVYCRPSGDRRHGKREARPTTAARSPWRVLAATLVFGVTAVRMCTAETKSVDFARDIRPILTEKCLDCHSGEEPEGGLHLGERTAALGPGESGELAIVPGRPGQSELLRRILTQDTDIRMPPEDEDPLSSEQVQIFREWIAEGAAWSTHWAFRPLEDVSPPQVDRARWVRNEIDRFTLSRMEGEGIAPSPQAAPHVLIKRLYYDLVGLPPPIGVVEKFAENASEESYQRVVEQLLNSSHFGERWGRHWLDLAHFADSDGYEKDRARPDAHIYRDWVIEAFNHDMPFDQFTIEQIAGDLVPDARTRQRIATGFLRQTLTNEEGGVDQEEYRIAACFDRTETVGTVWLGLTIGCVRCHEHKYDPILHDEYYKLFAFFNDAEEVISPLPVAADNLDELEQKLAPLEAELDARYTQLSRAALEWEGRQHARIMAQPESGLSEVPLEIRSVVSKFAPATQFELTADKVLSETRGAESEVSDIQASSVPNTDVYVVEGRPKANGEITGFKLYVTREDSLPNRGPGRASDGKFVLTGFQAFVVDEDDQTNLIELHRPKADQSRKGFAPSHVLDGGRNGRNGWSVGDQGDSDHWIQFRTREPIAIEEGQALRLLLKQDYGSQQLLGSFQVALLTGDHRGLHLSNESIANALEMYPQKRVSRTKQQLFDHFVNEVVCDERVAALRQEADDLKQQYNAQLIQVRTVGRPRVSRTTHVFHRGDFLSKKTPVSAGVPEILPPFEPRGERGDRLDLANWLINDTNFLTPRVAVNHIWQHLLGQGIVRTANDFGTRGEPPTHPKLLDWLALRFQNELNWSRKELIRMIVTSSTYRQASHFRPDVEPKDPRNEMLYRQNRFRVESEIVRDLHLAVSGLLSGKVGGPSVFPPMPPDLAKLSYANSFTWKNSSEEDRYRRGLYTFFKRTIPHPNLMTFDSPDANVACVARTVSNTPLQALMLLNNEVHAESAQAFASRILAERPVLDSPQDTDDSRIAYAVRLCLSRTPSELELASLRRVLLAARDYYRDHSDAAAHVVNFHAAENELTEEVAAWAAVARVVLNIDEFITRE